LAMGAVWDVSGENERLWLYGVSWLWMFDLSRDFPSDPSLITAKNGKKDRKRKRTVEDDDQDIMMKTPKKSSSGAGSRVLDKELELGIGRKVLKIQYDDTKGTNRVESHDIKRPITEFSDDENEEEDEDIEMGGLHGVGNGNISGQEESPEHGLVAQDGAVTQRGKKNWWSTFKYRPIMGIAPISGDIGMEVVLVERPLWEVDLPPRFYGDQEWEKPGL